MSDPREKAGAVVGAIVALLVLALGLVMAWRKGDDDGT